MLNRDDRPFEGLSKKEKRRLGLHGPEEASSPEAAVRKMADEMTRLKKRQGFANRVKRGDEIAEWES